MKNLTLMVALMAATLIPATGWAQDLSSYSEATMVKKYSDVLVKCPNGACPSEDVAKQASKLRTFARSNCNATFGAADRAKAVACQAAIDASPSTFTVGGAAVATSTPTPADCEKQGKELKGGKCVDKAPVIVALSEADCQKLGKTLKGDKCVEKVSSTLALSEADCQKLGKTLKGDKCVEKAPVIVATGDSCKNKKCGEHGTCQAGSCVCSDLWSGDKCQDAPTDCGVCAKVKKGDACQVYAAYPQGCVDAAQASANACIADTHEVKANGNGACGCDTDESVLVKSPDKSNVCPMARWKMYALIGGILFLLACGFLGFWMYRRSKKNLVNCPKDPVHPKGKPGTKCKCGEVYPEPSKNQTPAAPASGGSPAPSASKPEEKEVKPEEKGKDDPSAPSPILNTEALDQRYLTKEEFKLDRSAEHADNRAEDAKEDLESETDFIALKEGDLANCQDSAKRAILENVIEVAKVRKEHLEMKLADRKRKADKLRAAIAAASAEPEKKQ